MKPSFKVALVAGGYLVAFLVAWAAVALRVATTSGPEAQASSGMHAFGDAVLFIAIFGGLGLVPTGAALFFLRPYPGFWKAISTLGLVIAVTGIAAAVIFGVGRNAAPSPLASWAAISVLRILIAPCLALLSLVCAVVSPHRSPRLAFIAASAIEGAVSAYEGVVWLVPMLFGES